MGTLTAPPSRRFLTRIRNGKMGGVVLLGNGWLTRRTAAHVTAELQSAACTRGEPLLIAVDQEGGIVRRLAWAPPTEAPADMTSPAVAHAQAAGAAAALRSVGIDIDFAPVVDTPELGGQLPRLARLLAAPAPGTRQMAKAFVGGLQDERDRGDREALPRPRPRERQHRQRPDRDPGRRVEAPPGTAPVPGGDQGRREARDGLDRDLPEARRARRGRPRSRARSSTGCCGSSSASRASP